MKSVVAVNSMKQKVANLSWRALALGVVLGALVLGQSGCKTAQPGMTAAEVNRSHKRALRANTQDMMSDIDMVLMLDRPSHLTNRRLP